VNAASLDAAQGAPTRERPGVVLAAAFAVLAACGALWWTSRPRAGSLDRAHTVDAWFEPRVLPFGFEFAQAEQLARGDIVVRFERPGLAAEAEKPAPVELSEEERKAQRPFDWSAVDFGQPGEPPREFVLARLPLERAKSDLESLFKGGMEFRGDWKSIGREGGKRILGRGPARWGALDCAYVHEREFEAGGTFRDVVRVNLSRSGVPMLFIASFGRGVAGSIEPVEALLASLPPR